MVAINNIIALASLAVFTSAAALPNNGGIGANVGPGNNNNNIKKTSSTIKSTPKPTPTPTPTPTHPGKGFTKPEAHPTWSAPTGFPSHGPYPPTNGTLPSDHHHFTFPTKSWPSAFPTEWPHELTSLFSKGWPKSCPTDIQKLESAAESLLSKAIAHAEPTSTKTEDGFIYGPGSHH